MGNTHIRKLGRTTSDPGFDTALRKFESNEIKVLEQTFKDLAKRSEGPTLDKATFMRLFKLPGMLGERLFTVFDTKKNNVIDWQEFVSGLGWLVKGQRDDKVNFMFKMFDLSDDGVIHPEELETMLLSVVMSASAIVAASTDAGNATHDPLPHSETQVTRSPLKDPLRGIPPPNLNSQSTPARKKPEGLTNIDVTNISRPESGSTPGSPAGPSHLPRSTPSTPQRKGLPGDAIPRSDTLSLQDPLALGQRRVLQGQVKAMVDRAFLEAGEPSRSDSSQGNSAARAMTLKQFKEWVLQNPQHLAVIEKAFTVPITHVAQTKTPKKPISVPNSPVLSRQSSADTLQSEEQLLLDVRIDGSCQLCGSSMQYVCCPACGREMFSADHLLTSCGRACLELFKGQMNHYCSACGHNRIAEPTLTQSTWTRQHGGFTGYLKKVSSLLKRVQTRWFLLQDKFLYSFHHDDDAMPTHTYFLEGCYVEEIPRADNPAKLKSAHGFRITMSDQPDNFREFYAEDAATQKMWINGIKQEANVYNIHDYYTFGRRLGSGRYGDVLEAIHKETGRHYAVKVVVKKEYQAQEKEHLRNEIAILKLIDHPNIIKLRNVYETKERIYIVMSLITGGDMLDRFNARKPMSEDETRRITWKVLQALQYLHSRGIVHRDLKPENIMCRSDETDDIVLIDFGFSKFTTPREMLKLAVGTLSYLAPEVIAMDGYTRAVDLWSVGVMAYLFISQHLPFMSEDREQLIDMIYEGKVSFQEPVWDTVSEECKDLMRGLLHPKHPKRITAEQALKHKWFDSLRAEAEALREKHAKEMEESLQLAGEEEVKSVE